MLIPLGFWAASGAGSTGSTFELISTTILGSANTISFTSIPSGYKHLQIRAAARTAAGQVPDQIGVRLNNDTTAGNHGWHYLNGNGSSVTSGAGVSNETVVRCQMITGASAVTNNFGVVVIDILDAFSTSKNKTIRSLGGYADSSAGNIGLSSGFYLSTNAVTRVDLIGLFSANFIANSRFSLYGIKG
jgi:hypothetical protein